MDEQIKISA